MDRIKFEVNSHMEYPVEVTVFEEKTSFKKTYYSDAKNPEEGSHYAVCPACDNPVQVIGLYKRLKNTEKPYAKHIPKSIKDLANYVQENYDYCPLRAKRIKHKEYAKRLKSNELSLKMIQRLVQKFDRMIFFLEDKSGIFFSDQFARQLANRYFRNEGYLFYDASLNNIPIKLVHAAFPAHNLMGRVIFNQKLQHALKKQFPDLTFTNNKLESKSKRYIDLTFAFGHHEIEHTGDGQVKESFKLIVATRAENGITPLRVYEEVIKFDSLEYQEWVNRPLENLTVTQQRRSPELLRIVKEECEPFKFPLSN